LAWAAALFAIAPNIVKAPDAATASCINRRRDSSNLVIGGLLKWRYGPSKKTRDRDKNSNVALIDIDCGLIAATLAAEKKDISDQAKSISNEDGRLR
jgi:hypothetical protein